MTQNWQRIPQELRDTAQWCIAAPSKAPFSVSGHEAKVDEPSTWADFTSVATTAAAWGAGSGIGFVLHEDDGFACVDLDVKDEQSHPGQPDVWTSEAELNRYQKIIAAFDSYTERSKSGKGYHIWVRGKIGAGARRDGVEIYSQSRFMICTGNVYTDRPIMARQAILEILLAEIRAAQEDVETELIEVAAVASDKEVYDKAVAASNGAKFSELWTGKWQGVAEYPSQSEADLSLLSMLAFYSQADEQVRRLFRASGLGQREKATKNDKYLNRTLRLIRGRQKKQALMDKQAEQNAIQLVSRMEMGPEGKNGPQIIPVQTVNQVEWPPGPLGEIAQWFYAIAPRPVREVAIVSALGFFAGHLGRAYQVLGSGLNLYIVLVAKSAIGKEAMHSSISRLMSNLFNSGQHPDQFVDFSEYASGPALIKALAERQSFVNIAGEWGRKLRRMSDDHDSGPMSGLRTVMTNLYQKSSVGTIVGGIGYSDREKDVKSTDGVAYSMIGETTPDNFYESLTNTMMQDGFMSRFIIVEHGGLRPPLNLEQNTPLPDWVVPYYKNLTSGIAMLQQGQYYDVKFAEDALRILNDFNLHCDEQINKTDNESWRQMWNRAHLKTLKISAVLAVAENFAAPIVKRCHTDWALDLVNRDIRIMSRKMNTGDIGSDDMARERKVLSLMHEYFQQPIAPGYKLPDTMRCQGVIPRNYLQIRISRVNSFVKDKRGLSLALDATMKSLSDNGYILEVPRDKIPVDWGSVGRCFRVLKLPDVHF